MRQSIVLLIAYFGQWPPWINFFIESCRANRDIDWVIFTDAGKPENTADNVRIIDIPFDDYQKLVSRSLRINFNPADSYKICDVRPAFGILHYDIVRGYDWFGFGDVDVIYGRIRD